MKNSSQPPVEKYLIVLEPGTSAADLSSVAHAVDQPLVSSAELGRELPAREVYARGEGVYFKNLNIAVVDSIDPRLAAQAVRGSSPVMHIERDRVVRAFATAVAPRRPAPKSTPATSRVAGPDAGAAPAPDVIASFAALRQNLDAMHAELAKLEDMLTRVPDEGDIHRNPTTWGLRAIGWLNAGALTGRGVKVAVLDTGLDVQHPDFLGRQVLGRSFVSVPWDEDRHGHGTHCAGTVAGGRASAGDLAYGVAPGVDLVIGRVLDDRGSGLTSGIVDAIDWAIEKECRVVSMSLGSSVGIGQAPSPVYEQIGERALAQGCLLVAAAGNDSRRPQRPPAPVGSPANAESVLAVGAVDDRLRVASFSNGGINAADGGMLDIVGPGVDVLSAGSTRVGNSAYVKMSGTSMATPHVAGLAALYLEAEPGRVGRDLWDALTAGALALNGQALRDVGAGLAQVPQP